MSRVPPLDVDALTPEQKRVYDQIAGNRKTVRGPFPIWLRNAKLADHANQFGVALRDHSTIGRHIFELAVIVVCRAGNVQYAWSAHAPQAEAAGIAPEIVAAIRDNRKPEFKKPDERMAYEVATEIMANGELSQTSYEAAVAQFGLQGTVELVSTIGYYAMVGIFLKSFGVMPPDGSTPLT
jgi:4-carboxymuconolactone decarboxylase